MDSRPIPKAIKATSNMIDNKDKTQVIIPHTMPPMVMLRPSGSGSAGFILALRAFRATGAP